MKNKTFGIISLLWCIISAFMIWHSSDAVAVTTNIIGSLDGTAKQLILLPSSSSSAVQLVNVANPKGLRCGHIIINVSAYTSGSITPAIIGYDAGSSTYAYTLLQGSAISAAGTTVLKICPGITAAANVSASDILPVNWQLSVSGSSPVMTYSVSAQLIP